MWWSNLSFDLSPKTGFPQLLEGGWVKEEGIVKYILGEGNFTAILYVGVHMFGRHLYRYSPNDVGNIKYVIDNAITL